MMLQHPRYLGWHLDKGPGDPPAARRFSCSAEFHCISVSGPARHSLQYIKSETFEPVFLTPHISALHAWVRAKSLIHSIEYTENL